MGKKVHPLSFRLGITENHRSSWYSNFKDYSTLLKKDRQTRILIIELLKLIEEKEKKRLFNLHTINIERFLNNTKLLLEIKCLSSIDIKYIFQKYSENYCHIFLEIKKINFNQKFYLRLINNPSYIISSNLILNLLIQNIDKKLTFKRAIHLAINKFISLSTFIKTNYKFMKIFGLKIKISGRIAGVNLAYSYVINEGVIAVQTLKSNISYQSQTIQTDYGSIGLKVWVYNGFYN